MIPENHSKRFRLISLEIFPECDRNIRKILHPEVYSFGNEMISGNTDMSESITDKMYGKKVSIQVVVGKNGSGKTSLLDMMYRIINNFSYYLMSGLKQTQSSGRLSLVRGVYAKLDYYEDGEKWSLESMGNELALHSESGKGYRVGNDSVPQWHNFEDVNNADVEKVREVMLHFFYTVVTNYSFNSFLSSDYAAEQVIDYQGTSWVDNLFHKNDGYRTPLVFNPYRNQGQIDAQQETDFAVGRTIAILLQFQSGRHPLQFIDGYYLHDVEYKFNPMPFWKKFTKYLSSKERNAITKAGYKSDSSSQHKLEILVQNKFKKAFDDELSYASWILKKLDVVPDYNNKVQFASCCYIVYKVFSIIGNYPVYGEYSNFGDISFCFKRMIFSETNKRTDISVLDHAVGDLLQDKSHITYKFRIALNFLRSNFVESIKDDGLYGFSVFDYVQNKYRNVEQIMEALPITLFKPTIILERAKLDENGEKILVPFTSLSSGEKLFTYTLGTLVYHINNLKSVDSHRIHYRKYNIVMDELELCFHPEMQRQFVNKLITTIQRLRLNLHCHFNLLLVTHSPFILSDIPGSNILYLEDGKNVSSSITVNPFGTNINNVLSQNFFLGKTGFVGDIAFKNISTLVDYLKSNKPESRGWNIKRAEHFINNIVGDDVIRHFLGGLLEEKRNTILGGNETNFYN